MKLQILLPFEKAISGYEIKHLENDSVDLSDISDNECEEIILSQHLLSKMNYKAVPQLIQNTAKKLRINGKLILSEYEPRIIARNLIHGTLTEEKFNEIIKECQSMISILSIKEILKSLNLKIQTHEISGVVYECRISR